MNEEEPDGPDVQPDDAMPEPIPAPETEAPETGSGPAPEKPYAPPGAVGPDGVPLLRATTADERTMGMLAHLLGGPLGFIGPLIIWLIKKDELPFIDQEGKEALNFQICVLIAALIIAPFTCGFGVLPVVVFQWVFAIMGSVAANKGEPYRYPLTFRMIK